MNKTILNPKSQFLLGAGLDVLHIESKEWLETIAFWKDEVKFFNNLLKKKEASENMNPKYKKMLLNLNKIHTDLFDNLEENIVKHEQLLSRIELAEKGLSDNDYREKHRNIKDRMTIFNNNFRTFKSVIFEYSKSL